MWLWLALLSAELIDPDVLLPTEFRLWWPTDIFLGMGSPAPTAQVSADGVGASIMEEDEGSRQRRDDDDEADEAEDEADDGCAPTTVPTTGSDDAGDETTGAMAAEEAGAERILSHGCARISSSFGLWSGGTCRHCLMRSWHSWERRTRKRVSARQICSSRSKGMSPQTMS